MVKEYFRLDSRQTTTRTEVVAGVTTFLTMAYIIFVNPAILSAAGMDKQALVVVTCIASAIMTAVMGLIGNAPIAMAPGMGLNAFLAYSLVQADQITWETALGVVFLSGLLGFTLTLLGLRRRLVEAIPVSLVSAIAVGIGLFITFIGLVNMGVIVKNEATLVSAGPLTATVAIGLAGLLMMAFLEIRRIKGALLIGIAFSTLLAVIFGYVEKPASLVSFNFDIRPVAFRLDILVRSTGACSAVCSRCCSWTCSTASARWSPAVTRRVWWTSAAGSKTWAACWRSTRPPAWWARSSARRT